jgi:hypothetical protein
MSRLVKEGFNGKQSGMIGDGASDYAQAMGWPGFIPIDQFTLARIMPVLQICGNSSIV